MVLSSVVSASAEGMSGLALGVVIDGLFPAPDPEAPFTQKVLEYGLQLGVFGMMTGIAGPFLLKTINPANTTGGFAFLVGMLAGQQNLVAKGADISLQLKEEVTKVMANQSYE